MIKEVSTTGKGITKYIRYTSNGEPIVHPKSYDIIQDVDLVERVIYEES